MSSSLVKVNKGHWSSASLCILYVGGSAFDWKPILWRISPKLFGTIILHVQSLSQPPPPIHRWGPIRTSALKRTHSVPSPLPFLPPSNTSMLANYLVITFLDVTSKAGKVLKGPFACVGSSPSRDPFRFSVALLHLHRAFHNSGPFHYHGTLSPTWALPSPDGEFRGDLHRLCACEWIQLNWTIWT